MLIGERIAESMQLVHDATLERVATHLARALQCIAVGDYWGAYRPLQAAHYHSIGLTKDQLDRYWVLKIAINETMMEVPS